MNFKYKNIQKITISFVSLFTAIICVIFMYLLFLYQPTKINHGLSAKIEKSAELGGKIEKSGKAIIPEAKAESLAQSNKNVYLPILLYHKTPADFEEQIKILVSRGYTTVTMSEATDILKGSVRSPTKPIAITFDDGFKDQFMAFDILKKYNLKATSYIIVGSQNSGWCLGVEKKSTNCGDDYMNWNDIKKLKEYYNVEIGSHTMDHFQLSSLNESAQRYQIIESKKILEDKLGIIINSFAYPYGKYNQTTKKLLVEAGYTNATTVNASYYQNAQNIFDLSRIRKTNDLP
jgi:peptidoglycan/xylan/chitin deacetylase (PgdA/CDA1 family)